MEEQKVFEEVEVPEILEKRNQLQRKIEDILLIKVFENEPLFINDLIEAIS